MEENETNETQPEMTGQQQESGPQMQNPYMGNPYMHGYYNPYMYPPPGYPPMQGYYPPYPPHMQQFPPQYGFNPAPPPPSSHEQHCGHHPEDPMSGLFGMFGNMIENNPQLSEVGKMVNATGSDFIKGLVVGAGLAMLLSSETVRSSLSDILGKTMGMFTEETEEEL